MSELGPTVDPRRLATQRHDDKMAERQHRKDVVRLLSLPEFRRYIADVCYGYLGLESRGRWRPGAEIHRVAARCDVAADILAELEAIDRRAVAQLKHEHIDHMAGLDPEPASANPNEEEHDDE